MNRDDIKLITENIFKLVKENRDYLLDFRQPIWRWRFRHINGSRIFWIKRLLETSEERDLGKLFFKMGMVFNESAPSSLGTIISFWLLGIGGSLKGKEDADKNEMK